MKCVYTLLAGFNVISLLGRRQFKALAFGSNMMSIPGQDVRLVIAGEFSQQIRFGLPGRS